MDFTKFVSILRKQIKGFIGIGSAPEFLDKLMGKISKKLKMK